MFTEHGQVLHFKSGVRNVERIRLEVAENSGCLFGVIQPNSLGSHALYKSYGFNDEEKKKKKLVHMQVIVIFIFFFLVIFCDDMKTNASQSSQDLSL